MSVTVDVMNFASPIFSKMKLNPFLLAGSVLGFAATDYAPSIFKREVTPFAYTDPPPPLGWWTVTFKSLRIASRMNKMLPIPDLNNIFDGIMPVAMYYLVEFN